MDFLLGRVCSVRFALQGVAWLVRTQPNARIHLLATLIVVFAGWYFCVSRLEWAILALAIGGVWAAEALNTALEWAVDLSSPNYDQLAGKAKDVAAAGVMLVSLSALTVGALVFYPYIVTAL